MQQWEMKEVFTFPSVLGNVIEGTSFKVEPNWHQEVKDESILLKGVYVVKGHVNFDFEPVENAEKIEGISIEHLDIEKDKAYFEYAIPFSIDLPNDGDANIKMKVIDPQVSIMSGANCSCTWQVCCEVEKKEAVIKEKPIPVVEEIRKVKEQQEVQSVAQQEVQQIKEQQKVQQEKNQQEVQQIKVQQKVQQEKNQQEVQQIKVQQEVHQEKAQQEVQQIKEQQEVHQEKAQQEVQQIKEQQEVHQEIQKVKEQVANDAVEDLDVIKAFVDESKLSSSEEVDFFEQLAEAYSVIQVHLNTKK